ncbi:hypothetical protein GCM10027347_50340 [Larkinella harenae]
MLLVLWLSVQMAGAQNINRQQVNRLLEDLQTSRPDDKKIFILLELGKFHIYKPGESKRDLDSSRMYLTEAKELSTSLRLITRQHETESLLIVADLEGGNTVNGRSRFATLIADCQQSGDKEGEAIARYRLGLWLRNFAPDSTSVLTTFRRVAAMYRELHKPVEEVHALKEIAVTHLYEGKLVEAESELLNVLRRYKVMRYPKLHYTYNLLSIIGRLKGNLNDGLRYSLLCLESMKKTADTASAAAFYGDLAQVYEAAGNHPKSIEWFKKSLVAWRQERLPNFALYNTAGVLAKDLIAQQKNQEALLFLKHLVSEIPTNTLIQKACVAQNFAYCYDALQNYALAEHYYREALQRYEKNNLDFEQSLQIRQDMGAFYVKHQKYKEAGYYLTKALTILPQKTALSALRDIHFMLFKVDSAQGNYLSAIHHLQLYKTFNDSLFNEAKSKQISQLQIQYDTRAKEQNIALLTKQSELQQSALKRANTARNAMIVGAVLLTSLLGVSYKQYRLQQRSNKLLETKQLEIHQKNEDLQHILDEKEGLLHEKDNLLVEKEGLLEEKEWMLKEIHHRVKNNLQIISSLLRSQSIFLKDKAALSAIRESQSRVQVMAMIHQKLYQSDRLSMISMDEYIDEIVDYLLVTFDRQHSVSKRMALAPINLDVILAVPLGLILNEVITNSLKYAFSPDQKGSIYVELESIGNQTYRLSIGDNGVGFPPDLNPDRSHTLGMSLIRGLSKQLGGQLQINQLEGVQISLTFSVEKVGVSGNKEADSVGEP